MLLLAQADGYRSAGDQAAALNLLRNALKLGGVDEPTRIRMLDAAAELALVRAELDEAAGYAAQSVALEEKRAAGESPAPEALRDLSVSLIRLGDVDEARGDLAGAQARYVRSLELAERLAGLLGTPEALRDLVLSLLRLGDVDRARGDLAGAHVRYVRSLELAERLVGLLGTPEALRDLVISLERLAGVERELGNSERADALQRRAAEVKASLEGPADEGSG